MRNLVSLILLFLLGFIPADAVESNRKFDQDAMMAYQEEAVFDYSKDYVQSDSWITALLAYIFEKVYTFFDAAGVGWLTPWVLRILTILILIILVIYLVKSRYATVFSGESSAMAPASIISLDDEKVDFSGLLEQARKNGEYRLAIRYLFLKTINQLHQSKTINIRQWKAPYDYLIELPEEKRPPFKKLTDLFEITWYGEYVADDSNVEEGVQMSKQLLQ